MLAGVPVRGRAAFWALVALTSAIPFYDLRVGTRGGGVQLFEVVDAN